MLQSKMSMLFAKPWPNLSLPLSKPVSHWDKMGHADVTENQSVVAVGMTIKVSCNDERTRRFFYSFETPMDRADDG